MSQQFSNCKDAFYNNRQTIDRDSEVKFLVREERTARRCEAEREEVVLEETRL